MSAKRWSSHFSNAKKPRRCSASRYFIIPVVAFWALLHVSQVLLPPVACSRHLHGLRPRVRSARRPATDEFWKWAQSTSDAPQLSPCTDHPGRHPNVESIRNQTEPSPVRKRYYIMAVVSGGLNQQRNQIVDAVVVARILGAALVVPVFQVNQVWGDESEFADIFDVEHFKQTLQDDVTILSSLPSTHIRHRKVNAPKMPFDAGEQWLRENYADKLTNDSTVLVLRAFDSRLSKSLNPNLQRLRCKVAFEALRFQPWIQSTADRFVKRMELQGGGGGGRRPYLALHLRLEKDVWVRTGCRSGLGKEDDLVIEHERASHPQLLTSRSNLTAQERYRAGLCPLNAFEISRLLKSLDVPKHTRIYYAGGEPFGGEKALEPLRKQFANLFNKWILAKDGELDGMKNKPSMLAALDYLVCLRSGVFLANHGGNMARTLQGHRTFIGYGKHIQPRKKLLVQLFSNESLRDAEIGHKVKKTHVAPEQSLASLVRHAKAETDVIAFPAIHCMCNKNVKYSLNITRR